MADHIQLETKERPPGISRTIGQCAFPFNVSIIMKKFGRFGKKPRKVSRPFQLNWMSILLVREEIPAGRKRALTMFRGAEPVRTGF